MKIPSTTTRPKRDRGQRNLSRTLLVVLAAATALAAAACGGGNSPTATSLPTAVMTVTNLPGEAIARVNGQPLTRSEFEARLAQANDAYAADGADVTDDENQQALRDQLLERMISVMLVQQAAAEAGITADPAVVDKQFNDSAAQFETEEGFRDRLAALHLDAEQFRENIAEGLVMNAYITHYVQDIVPDDQLEPTEDEIKALYDETVAQLDGAIPTLETLRPSLVDELHKRKTQAAVDKMFTDLRAEADIEIVG